jgi:hypothetical protein
VFVAEVEVRGGKPFAEVLEKFETLLGCWRQNGILR